MSTGFIDKLGITVTESSPDRVAATVDLSSEHHQPHGIVHGGVYCAVVETLASIGGSEYWTGPGRTVVGVNNNTDFLRSVSEGTLSAEAVPLHRGRTQQLWAVTLTGPDGKLVARGQVRLANLER